MTARQGTATPRASAGDHRRGSVTAPVGAFARLLLATTALIAVPASVEGPVAIAALALAVTALPGPSLADGGQGGESGVGTAGGAGGVRSGPAAAAGSAGIGGTPLSGSGGGGGSAGEFGGAGGVGGDSTLAGDGGNGGAGGNAGALVTTSGNVGAAAGQNGAAGAAGGATDGGGGGGGEGGIGTVQTGASVATDVSAGIAIRGGDGGAGGDGDAAGGGGGGGDGGIGFLATGSGGSLTTAGGSAIAGGAGGAGGNSGRIAGAGGVGGAGIVLLVGGTLNLGGSVMGGEGGDGRDIILQTVGDGSGGDGGAGILAESGGTITLSGSAAILGGDRGEGGSSDAADGAAGAGIVGRNLSVSIGGTATVAGGIGDGSAALRFTGGANTLSLAAATSATHLLGEIDNAAGTLTLQQASDITFDTAIGGGGGIVKSGAGVLTLAAANSYTGTTTIEAGTLALGADNVLGAATGITVDGGTLELGASSQSVSGVALISGSITGASGILTSASDFDLRAGTVTARLGGAVGLAKTTAGTLTLSGINEYTGATIVSGGTLALGASGVIADASAAIVAGGELSIGTNDEMVASVTLVSGAISGTTGTLNATAGYAVESGNISARLGGSGRLTKSGAGTVVLAGANVYAGGTRVEAGTLDLQGGAAVLDTGVVDVAAGATLRVTAAETIGALVGAAGATADLAATLTTGGGGDAVFAGTASGPGGLVKQGADTFTLSGNNTYAGATTVNAGTLVVSGSLVSSVANNANMTIAGSGSVGGGVTNAVGATVLNAGTLDGGFVNAGTYTQSAGSTTGTIVNSGTMNADGGAFDGALSNSGGFTVGSGAQVTVSGSFSDEASGTLSISGGGAVLGIAGTLVNDGSVSVASGGTLSAGGVLNRGNGVVTNAGTLSGAIEAAGGTVTSTGALTGSVTAAGSAALVLSGTAGNVSLADSASLTVAGDLASGGSEILLAGNATMTVAGGNASGITRIDNASDAPVGLRVESGRRLTVGGLTSGSGAGVTRLDAGARLSVGTNLAVDVGTYSGRLIGAGTFDKDGGSTLILSNFAAVQGFEGVANVNGGTLSVDGVFGDTATAAATVNVLAGATLSGSGTIAGTVNVADGGTLTPGAGQGTLTITNLSLSAGSSIDYELGSANDPASALNDRTVVTGNLTLDGTLNVVGTAATGYYRIFDVNTGGAATSFTDNGLAVGVVPVGATGRISVIAPVLGGASPRRGEVNLQLFNGTQQMQFWDGGTGGPGDGAAGGGSGVWSAANTNWANDPNALFNDSFQGDVAIFRGDAGIVAVDGTQSFEGLQFSTDGYTLEGGTLAMTGDAAGGTADRSFVTVDTGVGATIASGLTGLGLNKLGAGTLVLSGAAANTYAGLTTVTEGTLRLAKDGALGATGFDNRTVLAAGTTLDYVAGVSIAETVELAGAATLLQDDGAASLAVQSGALAGSGQLTKSGDGILELTGSDPNTYAGTTVLAGGTLRLGKDTALGAIGAGNGTLAADGTTLDYVAGVSIAEAVTASGSLGLLQDDGPLSTAKQTGRIDGDGGVVKRGDGILVFTGTNLYGGATTVAGGTLALADDGSIAASTGVAIGSGATFDISETAAGASIQTLAGNGSVALGSRRLAIGAGSTAYGGAIAGGGGIDVNGGRQILSGNNSYSGGTRLTAGTLGLASSGALGTSSGSFEAEGLASGALLASGGTIEYADTVAIGNEIVVANGAVTFAQVGGASLQQGRVSGTGLIEKTGAGRLDFAALNGTFESLATSEGSLVATNIGTLGTVGPLGVGGTPAAGGIAIDARGGTSDVTNASGGLVFGTLGSAAGATLALTNADGGTLALARGSTSTLAGRDRIVNSGSMQFADSTTLAGVETFINTGTLSTTGGSLTYAGSGTDFVNSGVIDLQNAALGDSLVIDGSLTANVGSTLSIDVDFGGDNEAGNLLSDQLIVSGAGLGGITTVNFNNIADSGREGLQVNPIVVASFAGMADGADLVAANLPSNGVIIYRFGRDTVGNYTIGSTLNSDAVGGLAANFSSSQALITASLSRPTNSFVSAAVQPEPDQYGYAPWFRAIGGHAGNSSVSAVTNPSRVSETQRTDIDIDYAGGQLGFDVGRFNIGGEDSNATVGVTGGFNSGRALQDGFSNDTTFDTTFVGAYAAYTSGAFFSDAQLRLDYTDFEIVAPSVSATTLDADMWRLSLNASAGYTLEIAEGTSFVPSVGITYALLDTSTIATDFGDLVFEESESVIGFVSGTLARTFILPGDTEALTPFLTGTIYNDFGDAAVSTFFDINGLEADIVTDNIGTYGEIGVGVNYRKLFDENRFGTQEMVGAIRADFTVGDNTGGAGVTGQFRLQF